MRRALYLLAGMAIAVMSSVPFAAVAALATRATGLRL
jgi:hypothetical protein